jgi:hypothetical protein
MAKHLTAALALIGAASAPVQATPVSVTQTISLSELLAGNSTGISFNINQQLAASGQGAAGIQSGDLVVYGFSDAQYTTTPEQYSGYEVTGTSSHSVTVPYTYSYYSPGYCYYSWWSGTHCYSGYYSYATGYYSYGVTDYNTLRSRDILHLDDVADTMVVTAGADSATGSASEHSTLAGAYGNATYERTDGDAYNGYYYRYNRERDVYDSVAGSIQTTLHLDASALADLTADGIMDALVGATVGSFTLTSASLTVMADTAPPAGVPEPGTLALMGLAAAGGLAARRRSKKQ